MIATGRLAFAALLALLLAGCPGSRGEACYADEECAVGLSCFAGTCEELGTPDGAIRLYVRPPEGSGLQPAIFDFGEEPMDLCDAAAVEGRLADDLAGASVEVVGSPLGLSGVVERHHFEIETTEFSLPLPPGRWTLRFFPTGVLPPAVRVVDVRPCADTRLEAPIESPRDVGTLRFALAVDESADPRAACGVRVQVVDPASGAPLSASLAVDSGCPGAPVPRSLRFSHPGGDRIEVRLFSDAGALAALPLTRLLLEVGEDGSVDAGMLSVYGAGALQRVLLQVVDPDEQPVEGVRLFARSARAALGPDTPLVRSFDSGAAEDLGAGRYELWLPPGSYRFRAETGPNHPLGGDACIVGGTTQSCAGEAFVEAGLPQPVRLQLRPRPRLSGSIHFGEGQAIKALLTALPLSGGARTTVSTDAAGRFEVALDPGEYELLAQPTRADRPWLRQQLQGRLQQDAQVALHVPPAARVVGQLRADARLDGSLVRAYRVDGEEAVLLGEAASDAWGRFAVTLPAAP